MAATTATELIEKVRQAADMENSSFVTDDEILHLINDEIDALYAKMVNIDDGSLFAKLSPTLVQLGANSYQLPSNFLRLVDVNIHTGNQWVPAIPADPQDYLSLQSRTTSSDYDVEYFLHFNIEFSRYELFLFPAKTVANIGVRYIPECPKPSLGSDLVPWPSNWHEPVVYGAAARCLAKEESDPSYAESRKSICTDRVLRDIRAQKVAEVKTIRGIGRRNERRRNGRSV